MADTLKQKQEICDRVEKTMTQLLIQYTPVHELKLGDVLQIARMARRVVFDDLHENGVVD